jgi:hypothetical protein
MKDKLSRRDFGKGAAATVCWGAVGTSAPRFFAEQEIRWQRMSSSAGALPVPSTSREQTGDTIARLDKDSSNGLRDKFPRGGTGTGVVSPRAGQDLEPLHH